MKPLSIQTTRRPDQLLKNLQSDSNKRPLMVSLLQKLIAGYHHLISPWLGNRCRYLPTCSEYASEALETHGAMQGSILTAKRLCRCHPWGGHGLDQVPPAIHKVPPATQQISSISPNTKITPLQPKRNQ